LLRVFTNLTPYIPLSFKGERKRFIERGETPLLPTLLLPLLREGGQGMGCQTISLLFFLGRMYDKNLNVLRRYRGLHEGKN
jgi:hypothetical protein